jgi:hypothetical protein
MESEANTDVMRFQMERTNVYKTLGMDYKERSKALLSVVAKGKMKEL